MGRSLVIQLWWLLCGCSIDAQFVKQGCYDLAPIVCPEVQAPLLPSNDETAALDFVDIETTCRLLIFDLIPREITFDTSQHAEYLNSIEATDELCADIQVAYGQCIFCGGFDVRDDCRTRAKVVQCGGQPTREEVLMDNENYPLYQTDADITAACDAFEQYYGNIGENGEAEPLFSVDLCERQKQVKHLCPGECDGGCFTADVHLPTCEATPEATASNFTENRQPEGGRPQGERPPQGQRNRVPPCDQLFEKAFYQVDSSEVFNVSNHLEYLQSIHQNDSFCPVARRAYPTCIWCNLDNLCFNEDYPPSCDPPLDAETANYSVDDIETVCTRIYENFFDLEIPKDLYNTSKHTSRIAIEGNSTMCDEAQQLYHKCYWCETDVPTDFCSPKTACSSTVQVPEEFQSLPTKILNMTVGPSDEEVIVGCDEIFRYYKKKDFIPRSLQGCYGELILSRDCPDQFCPVADDANLRDESYLGATTTSQKLALIWVARVSAILSFLGASYVLYSSLSDANARKTVYHQLLIGMATFDIITALSWCLATIPIDASDTGTDHVYGVMGNEASCAAQGFFIQLGFTSVFYNVSLATYYVLVIAQGWREFQLRKIRLFLHALPCMLGLGLALGAIGSYDFMGYACHLLPYPEGDLWPVLVFVIIPLGFSIAAITSSMLVVYYKVRQGAAASRKWSFGVGKASVLEQAVFWQCVFYVLAFYLTWPIMFAVYLGSVGVNGPLGLALVIAFVAPLSGFTNFLVFIRPKVINARKKRASERGGRFSFSMVATAVQFLDPRRRSTASETNNLDEDVQLMRRMDPSVAIAVSTRRISQMLSVPELNGNESRVPPNNTAGKPSPELKAVEGLSPVEHPVLESVEESAAENHLLGDREKSELDVEVETEEHPVLESVEESAAENNLLDGRDKIELDVEC